jgi:hypothetical protein
MVVYVAGYPAIRGVQPLFFKDSELVRRARIPSSSSANHRQFSQLVAESLSSPATIGRLYKNRSGNSAGRPK